eukprot:TRINITY_DN861_c0_g1_i3.p1 TRINITY_DN861_c0_g1~~TRINITY_DN861_c0_g1_i3.p1  ORF type:complete len:159 (-),score=55.31 TRINITY_DN861_c0_g1_i3:35-463(-)
MAENTEKWRSAFLLFDRDGDGEIQMDQVGTVMRSLNQNPTQEEVRNITEAIGTDTITFEVFETIMQENSKEVDAEAELREAFDVFDKDGTGNISTAELRAVLTTMGEKLFQEEVDGVLKLVDNDGIVKLEDLLQTLLNPPKK